MRVILGFFFLAIAGLSSAAELDVVFTFPDSVSNPQAVRGFALYPIGNPRTNGSGGIVTRDRIIRNTGTNGSLTLSNLFPAQYRSELAGTYTPTTNWYDFTGVSGLVNAADYAGVPTNGPAGILAYSRSQSDARYALLDGSRRVTNTVNADSVTARSIFATGNATFQNHGNAGSPLVVDDFTGTNNLAELYNTVNGSSVKIDSNAVVTASAFVGGTVTATDNIKLGGLISYRVEGFPDVINPSISLSDAQLQDEFGDWTLTWGGQGGLPLQMRNRNGDLMLDWGDASGKVLMERGLNTGAGVIEGNGSGITNVTLSARAITNLSAPVVTVFPDGTYFYQSNRFAPVSRTAGIQEAINALPLASGPLTAGGGTVVLAGGIFYTYTNIVTPVTTNPFALNIVGQGMNGSMIVYVGTATQNVMTVSHPDSRNSHIFTMQGLAMASAVNGCTNILLLNCAHNSGDFTALGGSAYSRIEECWFGYWRSMTNNGTGLTFSVLGDGSTKHNLTGVNADGNTLACIIERCFFTFCGAGIQWACDQGTLRDNYFVMCGQISGGAATNDWSKSSPLSMGANILMTEPSSGLANGNKRFNIDGQCFIGNLLCYAAVGFSNSRYDMTSYNDSLESDDTQCAFVATDYGIDGTNFFSPARLTWTLINPRPLRTQAVRNFHITNTTDFSTWHNMAADPALVTVLDLARKTNSAGMVFQGSVTAASFHGDGRELTNLKAPKVAAKLSGAAGTLTTGMFAKIPFGSSYDPDGFVSDGTYTVPVGQDGGFLQIGASAYVASAPAGTRIIYTVYKNGALAADSILFDFTCGGANDVHVTGLVTISVSTGDTIEFYIFQDSGDDLNNGDAAATITFWPN